MKQKIINFSKKISSHLSVPDAKFTADMTYGIVASQSCLLTQTAQRLQENTKKIYTVDQLPDHLATGISNDALKEYLRIVRKTAPEKSIYCKGYHVTEACVLTDSNYPAIFQNRVTLAAMERGAEYSEATYVEDNYFFKSYGSRDRILSFG